MYVSEDTLPINSSNTTKNNSTNDIAKESPNAFFNDMVSTFMEEHTNKLKALSKSIELKTQEITQSLSFASTHTMNYSFKPNTSSLMQNIESYFSSSATFNSSFAMLENWLSNENDTQKSLIDYLLGMSKNNPKAAAETTNELFGVQKEVKDIISSITKNSTAMKDTYVSSAVTAIDMEVDTFGEENVFGSFSMEVKVEKIMATAVDSVDDCDLLTHGGNMVEFNGKYVDIKLFVHFVDPVVLDLDGDGFDLKPIQDGVVFDINGDGNEVKTGFVQGDDALLFFDSDGDGFCSSGKELFGDQEGDANGFAKMARFDDNGDGVLNSDDSIYKDLKVWNDLNGDGKSQKDEIRTLEVAGVSELGLGYEDILEENAGNKITQQGNFTRDDGVLGRMVDVQFRYTKHNIFDY